MTKINTDRIDLPVWLMIVGWLFFFSNLVVFGGITLFNPSFAFPDGGAGADFPIAFFAIRHIAFAVPLFHGLVAKDAKILKVMFTIFLVMTVLDIGWVLAKGYYVPVIEPLFGGFPVWGQALFGLFGFILPVVATLLTLKRLSK